MNLRVVLAAVAALLGISLHGRVAAAAAPARPNFIVVLVDDAGYADFPHSPDQQARTPNIDRLCDEGIRFTRFYVNSPICSPSRAALLTGQFPAKRGITSYIAARRENAERRIEDWLDPEAPSLARELQRAGYATGHFGKWHLGGGRDVGDAPLITEYGFDESLTQFEGLGDRLLPLTNRFDGSPVEKLPLGVESEKLGRGQLTWVDRSKMTSAFVRGAIDFIKRAEADGKPFYVNVWPDDVHTPLFPPADLRRGEKKRDLYLGVLEGMDRQLGELFDFVRHDASLRDNTVILVTSDNGFEPGAGSAGDLRGAKTTLYEAGVRMPLVVWGPGVLRSESRGVTNDASVLAAVDLKPSLLALAGAPQPASEELDGEDMSATLLGAEQQSHAKPLFWIRPPDRPELDGEDLPDLAVRDGPWKFLCEFDGSRPQLYDIAADPYERTNVVDQNPAVAKRLQAELLAWHASLEERAKTQRNTAAPSDQARRPNIVVILADDLGYSDVGCYGSEIKTPNIDKLAERGVRFRQFYNNGRCCPSRASLLTGRYPHQVGIGAMIDGYAKWIRDAADRPSYDDHLSTNSPTIAELLHGAGYQTLMCGKWHLGERPAEWPVARGFDRSFALVPGAMNYYGGESTGPRAFMVADDQRYTPPQDGFFATDAFTDRAVEFVDAAAKQEQPFFLYLPYNAPHWPLHAPPEDVEKYRGVYDRGWRAVREARYRRMIRLGLLDKSAPMAPMDRGDVKSWRRLTDEQRREWAHRMEIFAAQVTRMDDRIGQVIEQLERSGVAENTLVMVLSDNGGAPEDPHGGRPGAELGSRDSFWGYARPWATVSNTPWRRHKVTAYEGGVSGPAIAVWESAVPEQARGTFVDGPAHVMDLMPTFLELADADYPARGDVRPEGHSIVSMIKGESAPADRTLCWEHEGNRAIRQGNWKLVQLANDPDGWELYDLAADRIESANLAAERPEVLQRLSAEYDRWAERCGVAPWDEIEAKRPQRAGAK